MKLRKYQLFVFALGTVSLLVCGQLRAANIELGASLSGDQEVPPVATDAFGLARVAVDTETRQLWVQMLVEGIELDDLADNPGRFHIHGPAGMGENAPPLVDLGVTQAFFQVGKLIMFSQDEIPIPDGVDPNLIVSGQTYLNLHTDAFPGGEIRGQLMVPEPGTLALALAGLLLLGLNRRRRSIR